MRSAAAPSTGTSRGLALAGGADGLDLVARILADGAAHLTQRGLLVCEVGDGRAAVERRLAAPRAALAEGRSVHRRARRARFSRQNGRFASKAAHVGSRER